MKEIFNKINRQSLILGIIGTLICSYFLQPILEFLGNILILIFKNLSKNMYDRLFEEIALGKPDYSYTLIMVVGLLLFNFLLFLIIYSFFENKISEMREKRKLIENKKKSSKIFLKIFQTLVAILFLYGMVMSDIKLKTIQSFDQKIRIITPYVDQTKKNMIISKFSQMKTSEDYHSVMTEIQQIAKENNIELPQTSNHIF